jgi:hypothetical protein
MDHNNNKYMAVDKGENNKKHLHMLIQFENLEANKNPRDTLSRAINKYHPDSVLKHALVVNKTYNLEWYDEYLRMESDCEDVEGTLRP